MWLVTWVLLTEETVVWWTVGIPSRWSPICSKSWTIDSSRKRFSTWTQQYTATVQCLKATQVVVGLCYVHQCTYVYQDTLHRNFRYLTKRCTNGYLPANLSMFAADETDVLHALNAIAGVLAWFSDAHIDVPSYASIYRTLSSVGCEDKRIPRILVPTRTREHLAGARVACSSETTVPRSSSLAVCMYTQVIRRL